MPPEPNDLATLAMLQSLEDLRLAIPEVQHALVAGLRPRVPWDTIGKSLHLTGEGAKHRFNVAAAAKEAAEGARRKSSRRKPAK